MKKCGVVLFFCLLALVVRGQDQGLPFNYCSGTSFLSTTNGTFTDHDGGGPYQDDSWCAWIISPLLPNGNPADQVVLTFSKLDVEYLFDAVGIYQGTTTDVTVQWFTGEDFPTFAQQPFVVDGPAATVLFTSDADVAGLGFRLSYLGVDCSALNRCSGQGICTPTNGSFSSFYCECLPGWDGPYCSLPQPAQTEPYCVGARTATALTGVISERTTGNMYLNLQSCVWTIDPSGNVSAGDDYSLDLYFNRFDTERDYDYVYVRDAMTPASLNNSYTAYALPPAVRFDSGAGSVTFTSDQGVVRSGFRATYTTSICAGGCNNGTCMSGSCVCDYGFTGSACNQTNCPMDCNSGSGWGSCNATTSSCHCASGRYGPDCSLCSSGCPSVSPCDGSVLLTSATGHVSDSAGGACAWVLRPTGSGDTIVLSFLLYNLWEDGSSILVMDSTGALVGSYYGTSPLYSGGLPPPLVVSGTSLTINFDSGIDGLGTNPRFLLAYNSYSCAANCSGHGQCLPLDFAGSAVACGCDEGWEGAACDTPVCPGDCFGHGTCTAVPSGGSSCVCDEGYFGPSCSIPFCPDGVTTVLTAPTGRVRDHAEGLPHREGASCAWHINPAAPAQVTLFFTRFALNYPSVDNMSVYDGDQWLYTASGSDLPPAITSTRGSLLVTFNTQMPSNANGPLTGIDGYYITTSSGCPGGCGWWGYCDAGTNQCVCFGGAAGPGCRSAATVDTAHTLGSGQSLTHTLRLLETGYYGLVVPDNPPYRVIVQVVPATAKKQDATWNLAVYAYPGDLPNNYQYYATDLTSNPEKYATLEAPQSGNWYVSVQNLDTSGATAQYTISYSFACPDGGCANGGTCSSATNYACDCPSSYTGSRCDVYITSSSDALSGVMVALIVFFIFVAISVVVGIAFLIYLRYNIIKGYFVEHFVQTDMYTVSPPANEVEMGSFEAHTPSQGSGDD